MEPGLAQEPRGTFHVEWKAGAHYMSTEYHEPMPCAVFFAPGGIAFHGGSLTAPSHGCIHLDIGSARYYDDHLPVGAEVVVFCKPRPTRRASSSRPPAAARRCRVVIRCPGAQAPGPGEPAMAEARSRLSSVGAGSGLAASLLGHHIHRPTSRFSAVTSSEPHDDGVEQDAERDRETQFSQERRRDRGEDGERGRPARRPAEVITPPVAASPAIAPCRASRLIASSRTRVIRKML